MSQQKGFTEEKAKEIIKKHEKKAQEYDHYADQDEKRAQKLGRGSAANDAKRSAKENRKKADNERERSKGVADLVIKNRKES